MKISILLRLNVQVKSLKLHAINQNEKDLIAWSMLKCLTATVFHLFNGVLLYSFLDRLTASGSYISMSPVLYILYTFSSSYLIQGMTWHLYVISPLYLVCSFFLLPCARHDMIFDFIFRMYQVLHGVWVFSHFWMFRWISLSVFIRFNYRFLFFSTSECLHCLFLNLVLSGLNVLKVYRGCL